MTIPPWHATLWAHAARALARGRLAHGLLVCGAPGVGKRAFAQRLVRALACREPGADRGACGVCSACRQFAAGTYPDISRLEPDEPGRAIKVEQVRAFGHALRLTPHYDSGRIGWIDPAERLSPSAANSLLKTLEEPPAGCHIVLVSDRASLLMATIRSRCQSWRVPPAEPETGTAWLAANGVDPSGLDADARRAPYAAIARENAGYDGLMRAWDADLARLLGRRANPVGLAERAAQAAPELWVDWAYRRVSGLLAVSLGDPAANGLTQDLRQAAKRLGPAVFRRWAARVADAARLRATNADWRLVVESTLLDLAEDIS